MTLEPAIIAEVARLLAETDLTQRAIAKRTGVSRATIRLVSTGKRPFVRVATFDEACVIGPVDRCPGCGVLARISPETGDCYACQVRRRGGKATVPSDESTGLDVDLDGEALAKYEAMRPAARKRWLPWSRRSRVDKPTDSR